MKSLEAYISGVLESYLLEDLGTVFNIEYLKKISDLSEVLQYTETSLRHFKIGEGQGRYVYRLGNQTVLKVAKNAGGQAQNQVEIDSCSSESDSDLLPKVFESGEQAMWLVTQGAAPMTRVQFSQITGISWGEFMSALGGALPKKVAKKRTTESEIQHNRNMFHKHYANSFLRKVLNLINTCGYEPGDLVKLDSWGLINGKPVIIDSGVTENVSKTYYQGKS